MLIPRIVVLGGVIATGAVVAGLAWQVREHRALRTAAEAARATAATQREPLQREQAAAEERAAGAERKLGELLQAAERLRAERKAASAAGAGSARPGASGAATSAPGGDAIDTAVAAAAAQARGRELLAQGRPEEAVQLYLAVYRELRAVRIGSSECQRMMAALQTVARTHPAARDALVSLRDAAEREWRAQPARRELVFEFALLNRRLDDGARTLALYDELPPDDPSRRSLASIAREAFIAARRYPDALLGLGFGQMLQVVEQGPRTLAQMPAETREQGRAAIVAQTITNIEVLTGAGKADDARTLTERLLAFDGSEATRAALQRQIERAATER